MSDEHEHGPLMLCATPVLKPGPTRVGKIGGNFALPRTVALPSLIAGGIGAFVGLLVGMLLLGGGLQAMLMSAVFAGGIGVFLVSYQPIRGESMLRWLGLEVMSRRNRVTVEGKPAQMFIGICPITYVEGGTVRIQAGAINVPAGTVDEHGSFVKDPHTTGGGLLVRVGPKSVHEVGGGDLAGVVPTHDESATPRWAARRAAASGAPSAWSAVDPEVVAGATSTGTAPDPTAGDGRRAGRRRR